MTQVVVTFYKFVRLPDFAEKQDPLLSYCKAQDIRGTILLAKEGINGTIAGSRQAIDSVLSFLRSDPRLVDLEHKESIGVNLSPGDFQDTVGEFGKPNPPTPQPSQGKGESPNPSPLR